MKLDAIILKILSEKDLYGYQISTELKKLSNDFFSIKTGTLYPLLRTMVSNGLLDTYELDNIANDVGVIMQRVKMMKPYTISVSFSTTC